MKVRDITMNAMFIAITLILALVPGLGMINIGFVSITIMHIPVIIAGLVLGAKAALINATAFGVAAMFIAATRPVGVFDVLFVNPLVSVLPRIIFGLSIVVVASLMKRLTKNFVVVASVTSVVATLVHTVAVLLAMYIAATGSASPEILAAAPTSALVLIGSVLLSNGIFEIIASVVIAVPTSVALNKVKNH
ncbi:ECF transporter S component [Erysipelothrix aquatica]|uniref:ECF transporter S component n=1 Tax=Erysipelothrix aquatica TaxID=2683714 RepID=UPI001357A7DD|nr:ECF transporter S component [Erysipelothrix aquatica]